MLFVPTEVRVSTIAGAGMGLFAVEPISKGTLIWRWTRGWDVSFTEQQHASMSTHQKAYMERYAWRHDGAWRASLDNSRFVNHSKHRANIGELSGGDTVALRDIAVGEELLEDYSTFDPDFSQYAHELSE